jgi:hypothetical protein
VRGQPLTATTILLARRILYEVVTGHRAFQRETAADTLSAILNDQPGFGDIRRDSPSR